MFLILKYLIRTRYKRSRKYLKPRSNLEEKQYIKAGITSFPIIRHSTHIIKNVINRPIGPYTKDLILYNIIVIKEFHINIISEAYLVKKKAQYYRYNLIIRLGDYKENIVLI